MLNFGHVGFTHNKKNQDRGYDSIPNSRNWEYPTVHIPLELKALELSR
jgi:hypothetical protein